MTLMECFGSTFLAFGPSLAMFIFTIAKDPIRIIILIASAFFWLLSFLLSGLLWFVMVPLRDYLAFSLVFSVIFQELFRVLIYILLRKAEGGLKKVTDANTQISTNKHVLAYVAGLGFGIMSGTFALVNVLADSVGPGTVGLRGDSDVFVITSAATTLGFILLHIFWGVISFSALDNNNTFLILWVFSSHLIASNITLLNRSRSYVLTLGAVYILMFISALIAFSVVGGTLKSLKASLKLNVNPTRLHVYEEIP